VDFVYYLAYMLGYANPWKMLEEISPAQLETWSRWLSDNLERLRWHSRIW